MREFSKPVVIGLIAGTAIYWLMYALIAYGCALIGVIDESFTVGELPRFTGVVAENIDKSTILMENRGSHFYDIERVELIQISNEYTLPTQPITYTVVTANWDANDRPWVPMDVDFEHWPKDEYSTTISHSPSPSDVRPWVNHYIVNIPHKARWYFRPRHEDGFTVKIVDPTRAGRFATCRMAVECRETQTMLPHRFSSKPFLVPIVAKGTMPSENRWQVPPPIVIQ